MNPSLLVVWLTTAILGWTSGFGTDTTRASYLDGVSREVLTVEFAEDEPPMFDGPMARIESALLVAAVGGEETGFDARILRGDCSHWKNNCDGGAASCFMQIHAGRGIRLWEDEFLYALYATDDSYVVYNSESLREDTMACYTVGTHMLRKAMRRSHRRDICGYTGEVPPCTKGEVRMRHAREYMAAHPPPLTDEDVLNAAHELAVR